MPSPELTVIDGDSTYKLGDWRELRQYRGLFYLLVWRDIKTHYGHTVGMVNNIQSPLLNLI